jgi:methionine synthase II (cobalamin-independent)
VEYPWETGAATGIGSLPYTDVDEAVRVVFGELPDLPHLPELPGRGPGSDLAGRSAAMLVDLHVDLQPSGWRLVDRPGADERRAIAILNADLDAVQVGAHGYQGALKLQVAGPLTLAATIDRPRGDRVLADHGARRDLAQSLAEGVRQHVAAVAERVPGAKLVVQVDEPSLPAVLAGSVPTWSGFGRHRAVEPAEAEHLLAEVLAAAGEWPVVHCCASDVPVGLLRRAGAVALAVDVDRLGSAGRDELAEAVDGGLALWPGVVPALPPATPPSDRDLVERLERLFHWLDADPARLLGGVVVTPACGLAGAGVEWSRTAYRLAHRAARAFAELVGADG